MDGGREGEMEGEREGVLDIYYKLWKERPRTHNNGQRLDDAQLVHKLSKSVQ